MEYKKYLTDVKALNIVKEFLAENKDSISTRHKNKLVKKIIDVQRGMKSYEGKLK
jgi:hypothetical protein